jgi:hypothetical protein
MHACLEAFRPAGLVICAPSWSLHDNSSFETMPLTANPLFTPTPTGRACCSPLSPLSPASPDAHYGPVMEECAAFRERMLPNPLFEAAPSQPATPAGKATSTLAVEATSDVRISKAQAVVAPPAVTAAKPRAAGCTPVLRSAACDKARAAQAPSTAASAATATTAATRGVAAPPARKMAAPSAAAPASSRVASAVARTKPLPGYLRATASSSLKSRLAC